MNSITTLLLSSICSIPAHFEISGSNYLEQPTCQSRILCFFVGFVLKKIRILSIARINLERMSHRETILMVFKKKLAELVKEKMVAKERLGT